MEKIELVIHKYLMNNLKIILDFPFSQNIYLLGGAITDFILNRKIKDLDFVLQSNSDQEIQQWIAKYSLPYEKNSFDGYRVYYSNIKIDIWNTTDLSRCIEFNFDGLFYNLKNRNLLFWGFIDCLEKEKIIKVNNQNNLEHREEKRRQKQEEKLLELLKIPHIQNYFFK